MKTIALFLFVSSSAVPQSRRFRNGEPGEISAEKYATEVLNTPLKVDGRIKATNDQTSPSAAAALAYMKSAYKDGLCGLPAAVYLKTIFSGKTKEEANAEAAKVYIEAYNTGERLPKEGGCAAAEGAYREAWEKGDDPILEAATAYINDWPGAKDGNPCAVAGIEYMNAIVAGKSHDDATKISMSEFANAFKEFGKRGRALKDTSCRDATKAFFDAIPEKQDPAYAAAFTAFTEKFFETNAPTFDPVCIAALEGFIESYNAGDDVVTANLKAARSFLKEFAKGSILPADSPCTSATIAYTNQLRQKPSKATAAAMIKYITEAIKDGRRKFDPVCAAATEAYFDSYIETKSETTASEAAAIAYLDTLDKNPNFDLKSPCGTAAKSYIEEYY